MSRVNWQRELFDFGVKPVVGPEDGDAPALEITVAEARRLTPAYASPEQVHGVALTTASDVCSLGALRYELPTGATPHRFNGPHPAPVKLPHVTGEQEPVRVSLAANVRARPGCAATWTTSSAWPCARTRRGATGPWACWRAICAAISKAAR